MLIESEPNFAYLSIIVANMPKTRSDLHKLLESHKEALNYWQKSFTNNDSLSPKIKAAEVANPLEELSKLGTLIRAHVTKVGIVFKPQNLKKGQDAAFTTLLKLSGSIILMVSVISQLKPEQISHIFNNEILDNVKLLLHSNSEFVDELIALEADSNDENNPNDFGSEDDKEISGRLVSVAKIWSNCDDLCKLIKNGELGLLAKKVKQSISLIDDGLDEFEEFTENPDTFDDDDDPFGLDEDDSEDESENTGNSKPEENQMSKEDKSDLIKFSKLWLSKVKLVKLLLLSLTRSLPSVTSGETINNIYDLQRLLANIIDKLIVDLMLNKQVDAECEQYSKDIIKSCNKLIKIVQDVNKSNETKVKWCTSWESKFKEGL